MHVRPFQLADYAAVTQLMEISLSEECCIESKEAFARQLSWDSSLVLVAELENKLVGLIIGTIDEHNNGYYYRVAVDPAHRRQGIGKSLIRALESRFTDRKVNRMLVPLDSHNEPVVPVYMSLGFDMESFTKKYRQLRIVASS